MKHYKSLIELRQDNGYPPPENPFLSLFHCKETKKCQIVEGTFTGDFYMIGFKKMKSGSITYGRTKYDHDNGSLSFFKPRQIIEIKEVELEEKGFLLFIHEDYLFGHNLHADIKNYSFFDYEINEALHLSPREEEIIWELYFKIENENSGNPDEYTRDIILAHIHSILKYSQRFYKRQFINRSELSGATLSKFNALLGAHLEKGLLQTTGLPTVKAMSEALNTSARYLSDTLRQETGKTALELIHIFLIGEAKNLLQEPAKTIAETAYSLGFENPPYFSRLFKKETGFTPLEYRKQLLN